MCMRMMFVIIVIPLRPGSTAQNSSMPSLDGVARVRSSMAAGVSEEEEEAAREEEEEEDEDKEEKEEEEEKAADDIRSEVSERPRNEDFALLRRSGNGVVRYLSEYAHNDSTSSRCAVSPTHQKTE